MRFPVVSTIVALLAIVILLKLGFWQLQRATEKQQIQQELARQGDKATEDFTSVAQAGSWANFTRTLLTGSVHAERVLLWDNRVVNGKVGYEVLAPVTTPRGIVLANFGWVADISYRQSLPEINLPEMVSELSVELYLPKTNPLVNETNKGDENWPKVIQQPELETIGGLLRTELLPTMAFVQESEIFGLHNNYRPVTMGPEKHRAYALQWFGLAVACTLIYLIALKKKLKHDGTKKSQ